MFVASGQFAGEGKINCTIHAKSLDMMGAVNAVSARRQHGRGRLETSKCTFFRRNEKMTQSDTHTGVCEPGSIHSQTQRWQQCEPGRWAAGGLRVVVCGRWGAFSYNAQEGDDERKQHTNSNEHQQDCGCWYWYANQDGWYNTKPNQFT